MCGIAGLTTFNKAPIETSILKSMGDAMIHRGPDAGETFSDENVGLVHRRLAIIDLSEAGVQPMTSHDGKYVIVFNGEIYNFLEQRAKLEKEGYPFKTHTDTEVILALYAKHGHDCVQHLNGMFAFALWDIAEESLFIARDRMGKKPLYYYQQDGDLYFASELKCLLAIDAFPKNVRLDAAYDFFAHQYVPDPKTIFENVFKLEAGHTMVFDRKGMKIKQYWNVSFANQSTATEADLKAQLQEQLKQCTARRMVSDVPLGAFLSGGVDSSGVVAMMAEASDKPITTCSIGFDEKKFNETEFAASVAKQYKTDHHELFVHENVADSLEHIASFFDEPFADPSLVPTYFVSKLAREKVTVAVAGDGGDEVFAGYSKYNVDDIENRLRMKFPAWLRKGVFPGLAKMCSKVNLRPFKKANSLLTSLSVDPAMGFYITNSMMTDHDWQQLAKDEIKAELGSYHPSENTVKKYNEAPGDDHLSKILYTDLKTYLVGGILVKVDRMSMANSLEVRAPILDYEVVELAASMPSNLKYNDGEKKYILKEAFKPYLNDDILYRKKMGFSVPLANWLRNELKELVENKLILQPTGLAQIMKTEQIAKLWQQHVSGAKDHSNVLWSMLVYQLWWDCYMADSTQFSASSD